MTMEEAIKMVQAHKFPKPTEEWQMLNNEAIDMAIEALSADAKGDLIRRSDIQYHTQLEPMGNGQYSDVEVAYKDDIDALPSADAETITEEVREALMRLTMCAREECDMCKYKDECDFDFQYKISTDNMNTLSDALMRSRCEVSRCRTR